MNIFERINYVTFEISTKCNMDCEFCFSEWREQNNELDLEKATEIIFLLKEYGVETINFTGGEPLLRKDLPDILRYSKELGITNILSTNGIVLEQRIEEICGCVDFIGLPLDSSDREVHNSIRPSKVSDHYQLVQDLIDMINRDYSNIGVKINTLVSGQNVDSVLGIGELLEDKKIVSWKLSHFVSSGYGKNYENKFDIGLEEYRAVVVDCGVKYSGITVISSEAHEQDDYCRVVSSEGHLMQPNDDGLMDLGSLVSVSKEDMKKGYNTKKSEDYLKKTYGINRG